MGGGPRGYTERGAGALARLFDPGSSGRDGGAAARGAILL